MLGQCRLLGFVIEVQTLKQWINGRGFFLCLWLCSRFPQPYLSKISFSNMFKAHPHTIPVGLLGQGLKLICVEFVFLYSLVALRGHVLLTASGLAPPHSRAKITLAKTATLNPSTIDNITTVTMPKEVKQKSGLILGLNAGHSTSCHSHASDGHESLGVRKYQIEANMANRGHSQDPRS